MNTREAEKRLNVVGLWSEELLQALGHVRSCGGVPYLVGGVVRDILLDSTTHKDVDVEVHGLGFDELKAALFGVGEVDEVGASFTVLKVKGLAVDFSLPRRDSKVGPGHKGIEVLTDPHMGIEEAARRRDLTINSIYYDVFAGCVHDPFGGLGHLSERILHPVDPSKFLEDPLRALRAAQFCSRLGFCASVSLLGLCSMADLSELAGERVFEEFRKLLMGRNPAKGLEMLRMAGLLHFFPEIDRLDGCQQDPEWHSEGDVLVHTTMAMQIAADLDAPEVARWAVLCHDFGKPSTTVFIDGRWRSRGHEDAGVEPAQEFLGRLRAPNALVSAVSALVRRHLAPAMFCRGKGGKAGPGAFRRLALELADAGTDIETLYTVAKADHFGRTTPDALARQFPAGEEFLAKARNLGVGKRPEQDAVLGRHLIARGMEPGPEFGRVLKACRDFQFETGTKDPQEILDAVLGKPR